MQQSRKKTDTILHVKLQHSHISDISSILNATESVSILLTSKLAPFVEQLSETPPSLYEEKGMSCHLLFLESAIESLMEGIINLERIDNVERHEGDPSRDDQFQDIYHLSRSR